MSTTGDPNAREDVPFPNPQAAVPPGPAFQQPQQPPPVQQAVNGTAPPLQPPTFEPSVSLTGPNGLSRFSPEALALLTRMGQPTAVGYHELSSLIKQARTMPYERLMGGAEMVVELAQMLVVDCTKAGH